MSLQILAAVKAAKEEGGWDYELKASFLVSFVCDACAYALTVQGIY